MKENRHEKILLVLLPFWDPQIPPMGLACIKGVLRRHGYQVTTADANIEKQFRGIYDRYFNALKEFVPADKGGNIYKTGHEVLRNHMMAHINYRDKTAYLELVKILVYETFYCQFNKDQVQELVLIIENFYLRLENYFLDLLRKEAPSVLGLSVFGGTFAASMFAFRLARRKYPHIKTIMGGGIFSDQLDPHSPDLEYFLEISRDYIDNIFIGEGELLLLKYMQKELPQSQRLYSLADLDGEYLDPGTAGIPDYSDFDLQHYVNLGAYGSRSCPYQCSFCSEASMWGQYRKKSAKQTAEELFYLSRTYGSQLFLMGDSLMNPIITGLAGELIRRDDPRPVYWDGFLRVDRRECDEDTILSWRRGGFYRARLGCESGSQRILESMGKKITTQQIKKTVSSLAHAGIKTSTMWVVGYPGETETDFQQTLDLIEQLKDDIFEADCTPYYFFPGGQPLSSESREKNNIILLYPEEAGSMLITQTWIIDTPPYREERYRRLNRFTRHIRQLGIPNPYSLKEIYEADERWKRLHKTAVPPLLEFRKDSIVHECKQVDRLLLAKHKELDDVNFGF